MSNQERSVARMFGIGFDGKSVPKEVDALLARGVSHAILFRRNCGSASEVHDLCADLKHRAARPLAIGIDHEGGRVMRVGADFTQIPAARDVGATRDQSLAMQIGQVMARELRAVNIDIDFAPVLDVDTNPANPVIGARAFATDPETVSRIGCAVMQGIQSQGVAACGKHFPGHGDTSTDSHYKLPRLPHTQERLDRIELVPFVRAIAQGIATIMTAHVIYSPIDSHLPATMSREVLTGILRQRMKFGGVIYSDDLEMKAISEHYGIEDALIKGANAGVDVFWICHNHELQNRAIDLLIKAVERGDVLHDVIARANQRIDALLAGYCRPPSGRESLKVIGCDEHRRLVDSVPRSAAAASDPTERWQQK